MTWVFFATRIWLRYMKNRKIPGYGETKTIHTPKKTSLIVEAKIAELVLETEINKKLNEDRKDHHNSNTQVTSRCLKTEPRKEISGRDSLDKIS